MSEHEEPAASEPEEIQFEEENHEPDLEQEQEPKMVPLSALQAERRKRQDLEYQISSQEQEKEPEVEYDPNGLVENKDLQATMGMTKREIKEEIFRDMNPAAVQKINKYLKPILEKKPWLAESVDTAQNRYARASEIVDDYMHLIEPNKPSMVPRETTGERIVKNAEKPRSPAAMGKSAQLNGAEYLKSIRGTSEFRDYRTKMRNGR